MTERVVLEGVRRSCAAGGCFVKTNEGKPYCADFHLQLNPYAGALMDRNARRWGEEALASEGRPDVSGELAQAVAGLLAEHGNITIVRVAYQLDMSLAATQRLIEAMVDGGVLEGTIETRTQWGVEVTPMTKVRCYRCWAPIRKAELSPRCEWCKSLGRKPGFHPMSDLPPGVVPLPDAKGYASGQAGNRR